MTHGSSNPSNRRADGAASPEIRPVPDHKNQLGEGPSWFGGWLLHVDILAGKVHSLDPTSGELKTLKVPGEVSAAVPRTTVAVTPQGACGQGRCHASVKRAWPASTA
jgi:sugar lactone lactonase YvrE